MGEKYKVLNTYAFKSKDYEVTAKYPWKYALSLRSDESADQELEVITRGMQKGRHPFSYEGSPVMIMAKVGGTLVFVIDNPLPSIVFCRVKNLIGILLHMQQLLRPYLLFLLYLSPVSRCLLLLLSLTEPLTCVLLRYQPYQWTEPLLKIFFIVKYQCLFQLL